MVLKSPMNSKLDREARALVDFLTSEGGPVGQSEGAWQMWASAIFRRSDGTSRTRERIRPEH